MIVMKRIIAIIALSALIFCVVSTPVFSDSFVYEESENYNISQILTRVQGERGFSFYVRFSGSEERILCTNETGQYDSRNWIGFAEDGGDISLRYWENDVQGNDSYFWVYPALGEVIIAFTAPMTGNLTFDIEACLQEDPTGDENGILIICEREDGDKLIDDIEVVKAGKYESGMARHSPKNVMKKVNFEIVEGETVYLRFNNRGVGGNDQTTLWLKMKYNRIGEESVTEKQADESTSSDGTVSEVVDTIGTSTTAQPDKNDIVTTNSSDGSGDQSAIHPALLIGIIAVAVIIIVAVILIAAKKNKK